MADISVSDEDWDWPSELGTIPPKAEAAFDAMPFFCALGVNATQELTARAATAANVADRRTIVGYYSVE